MMAESNFTDCLAKRIGRELRTAREDSKLSQDALAYLAGVSLRSVQRLEGGQGANLSTFLKVRAVLFGEEGVSEMT